MSRLILLSPAGVPEDPNIADATLRASAEAKQSNQSLLRRVGTHAWEAGWSPFQIIRSSLFWGPLLVGKVCRALVILRVSTDDMMFSILHAVSHT